MSILNPKNKIAVLLMAHGGPDSLDDIEPFLGHIMKGGAASASRVPSPEIIAIVRDRYQQIGGKSPLLAITRQQAESLAFKLNERSDDFRVYVGMRHWSPYIKDVAREILHEKPSHLIAISMAPQYSRLSVGAYIAAVRGALSELGSANLPVSYVTHWHTQPLLLDAFSKKVKSRILAYPESLRKEIQLVFTAHSLPETILAEGDPYPTHLQQTMDGIVSRLGALLPKEKIQFAYQSKGMSGGKWLGPDMEAVLKGFAENSTVLMAPIGFVADHVEILYDIDIYYKEIAKARGINLNRIESLNTAPLFIHALAAVVHANLPL